MAETNLAFSKVVATPTPTAWSQAYSAGRLFAAISLQIDIAPNAGEENLNSTGKDLISTMESEFFTLENKDLNSIKLALETTVGRIREGIKISLVVCFLNDNVLYLFATGGAKAVLKRGDKIGTVLQADENESAVKSASGYVQEKDIIILQTKAFLRLIPPSTLASSLDHNNPEEIAENLAPFVHEKAEGGASAVILLYKEGETADIPGEEKTQESETISDEGTIPVEEIDEDTSNIQEESKERETELETEEPSKPVQEIKTLTVESAHETEKISESPVTETVSPFLTDRFPRRKSLSLGFGLGFLRKGSALSHQRKIILTIAVILISLIAVTSLLALRNRGNSQNQKVFASVMTQAEEKYDEGQNLKDLNVPLAQESFRSAKQNLEENKDTFREGLNEDNQIEELLSKVNKEISDTSEGKSVTAKEVEKSKSNLLSYELNNSDASYFTQNDDFVYFLDGKGVSRIDKGNDEKKEIIKKTWKEGGGIGLFGSNVYVLDKQGGVFKFSPSGEDFSKGNYFYADTPDLSNAAGMAIDGSVYILFKTGTIDKYTRGKKDTFEISGLDKGLSSPTRIFTNDESNLYVLDNGNSRVVVLDKDGKFKSAYSASVLKNAKDIDVQEAGKKIFALSNGKVYQIDLK